LNFSPSDLDSKSDSNANKRIKKNGDVQPNALNGDLQFNVEYHKNPADEYKSIVPVAMPESQI
jgi:hypothetical protein